MGSVIFRVNQKEGTQYLGGKKVCSVKGRPIVIMHRIMRCHSSLLMPTEFLSDGSHAIAFVFLKLPGRLIQ